MPFTTSPSKLSAVGVPSFPSSFDPAVHLHSEVADDIEPSATYIRNHNNSVCSRSPLQHPSSSSFANDLEALRQQVEEDKAAKTRQGIVIQHRSWRVPEVFRSEEDYIIDSPSRKGSRPSRTLASAGDFVNISTSTLAHITPIPPLSFLPSSPPEPTMAFAPSSPVTYPISSSPIPKYASPRKKRRVDKARVPLDSIDVNQAPTKIAGFVMSDSEDDEETTATSKTREEEAKTKESETWKLEAEFKMPETYRSRIEGLSDDAVKQQQKKEPLESSIDIPSVLFNAEPPDSTKASSSVHRSSQAPLKMQTCTGKAHYIADRAPHQAVSFERLIASRSTDAKPGRARKNYYGIDIHKLMDEASAISNERTKMLQDSLKDIESVTSMEQKDKHSTRKSSILWTEKYRARKFTDLVGDERTHRSVLRWLKSWDPIVFPGASTTQHRKLKTGYKSNNDQAGWDEEQQLSQRKILLLTGPPGLGKTTLAHVCARQAGYKVQEINASDERSRDVVRGRIKDMVGTENVRTTTASSSPSSPSALSASAARGSGKPQKSSSANRPLCIVVDEVDGVVSGNSAGGGSGEGGFMKALIDLVATDRRNSALFQSAAATTTATKKKKNEKFRILRPIILICNDVYHPSLRPLRQSGSAEIIHVRKAPLNMVASRLEHIFRKENLPCDSDAVRRLCEVTWGLANKREGGGGGGSTMGSGGEGDVRSILVMAEGIAQKLRCRDSSLLAAAAEETILTRAWIEQHVAGDYGRGGGSLARGLGRGSAKEVVERVFREGAGFAPTVLSADEATKYVDGAKAVGVAEVKKKRAMEQLREMVETSAEFERIMTDCFTNYPVQPFQDDDYLSKPAAAYEWLDFFDRLNSAVYTSQEWELSPYLSTPVLAMHHLFASSSRPSWNANIPNSSSFNNRTNGNEHPYVAAGSNNSATAGNAATAAQPHPLSLSSAPFISIELTKQNKETLSHLHSGMALPVARMYSAPDLLATELAPYVLRILAPAVNPVVVGGSGGSGSAGAGIGSSGGSFASVRKASEKAMVARAVGCMGATGVRFARVRVGNTEIDGNDNDRRPVTAEPSAWIYRMHPPVDELVSFGTMSSSGNRSSKSNNNTTGSNNISSSTSTSINTVRYSVRQVLDQEWKKEEARLAGLARMRRGGVLMDTDMGTTAADAHAGAASSLISGTDSETREGGKGKQGTSGHVRAGVNATSGTKAIKRDFFGRPIMPTARPISSANGNGRIDDDDNNDDNENISSREKGSKRLKRTMDRTASGGGGGGGGGHDNGDVRGVGGGRIWVSFNEGYSNAVRKPVSLAELLASFQE